MVTTITLIITFVLMSISSTSGTNDSGNLPVNRTPDFEITGNGSSPEWSKAEWENIPQRSNGKVNYITKAKVLYSGRGIYFLFYCEDKIITATMQGDNLNLWEEDVVEVFLMPDEKYPLYFEYQLSPLNYELTLLIPNLDGDFLGWLPWKYEGERRAIRKTIILKDDGGYVKGWMAEFFIPFKLMEPLITSPPQAGEQWKANMYRLDYDQGQARFSWQQTDIHFHEPRNFGTLTFK